MIMKPADISASGQVHTGGGRLYGAVLAAGSAAATLVLYDGTSTSGIVIARLKCAANTSAVLTPLNVSITSGVYAEISGTGAAAVIYL